MATANSFSTTYTLSKIGGSQMLKPGESVSVKTEAGQSAFVTVTNVDSLINAHYEEYDKENNNQVKSEDLAPFKQSGTATFMQYGNWVRVYNRTTEETAGQPLPPNRPTILVGLHAV